MRQGICGASRVCDSSLLCGAFVGVRSLSCRRVLRLSLSGCCFPFSFYPSIIARGSFASRLDLALHSPDHLHRYSTRATFGLGNDGADCSRRISVGKSAMRSRLPDRIAPLQRSASATLHDLHLTPAVKETRKRAFRIFADNESSRRVMRRFGVAKMPNASPAMKKSPYPRILVPLSSPAALSGSTSSISPRRALTNPHLAHRRYSTGCLAEPCQPCKST